MKQENLPPHADVTLVTSWQGLGRDELDAKAREVTESSGVYVFRGEDGQVLYVGKARNLRNRLRSYFGHNLSPKTWALMEKTRGLEVITVNSEKEALILESNLIKKYRPRYNIIFKDDKNYPYLKIDPNDPWPRVTLVRRMEKDGARYFGPFTSSKAVRETLRTIRRIFPYRNCKDKTFAGRTRPCLDYHIGRCLGPCVGKVDRETYMKTIQEVTRFLEGRHKDLRKQLEEKMQTLAEDLRFEEATRVRDQIKALDEIIAKQRIVSEDMKDRDVLGIAKSQDYAFLVLLPVREGKLMGREGFLLKRQESFDDGEILEAFISQYYSQASYAPPEILVPKELPSQDDLDGFLPGIRIRAPRRGPLKDLLLLAQDNARTMLKETIPKKEREEQENQKALKDLASALNLGSVPHRIEGYDISNISGHEAVGSMVVIQDGKPDKASYRHFKIKVDGKPNDFAMMQEVLWRRFKRGFAEKEKIQKGGEAKGKFSHFPDLILIDGGKGQVSAAVAVLDELGLQNMPIFGLAKRNEEIYLPYRSEPIILPRDSGALYMIVRLRDEAHRFAISYHRKMRGAKMTQSILGDIPGVGPIRQKRLLKAFGSVQGILDASIEDLAKVEGIGETFAQKIKDHIKTI